MKKVSALMLIVAVAFALGLLAEPANAVPAFDKAWKERYTKDNEALKAKADLYLANLRKKADIAYR